MYYLLIFNTYEIVLPLYCIELFYSLWFLSLIPIRKNILHSLVSHLLCLLKSKTSIPEIKEFLLSIPSKFFSQTKELKVALKFEMGKYVRRFPTHTRDSGKLEARLMLLGDRNLWNHRYLFFHSSNGYSQPHTSRWSPVIIGW